MATTTQRYHYGTGRRKSAVARVRMVPGNGVITVNGKEMADYFGGRTILHTTVQQPLVLSLPTSMHSLRRLHTKVLWALPTGCRAGQGFLHRDNNTFLIPYQLERRTFGSAFFL